MKLSKKLLSLLLCAVMVLGTVAVDGGELSEVLDVFSVKAAAANNKYKTLTGILENYTTYVVLNGSKSYVSSITIDGKEYDVDGDFISVSDAEQLVGKMVVVSLFEEKIVYFNGINSVLLEPTVVLKPSVKKLVYSDGMFNTDSICLTVTIYNNISCDFTGNIYDLKDKSFLKIYVSSITLESNFSDYFKIDGKDNKKITVNDYISIGSSLSFSVKCDLNAKKAANYEYESDMIPINYSVIANRDGTPLTCISSGQQFVIDMENKDYVNPEKPIIDTENKEIDSKAAKAASELSKIHGAVSIGSESLYTIFSSNELDEIQNMILCQAAMWTMPEETLREKLTDKVVSKLLKVNTKILGIKNGVFTVTIEFKHKEYGALKVTFNCDISDYLLNGSGYAFFGDIDYEISGSGLKNLKKEGFSTSGICGGFAGVDMKAFCNAASDLAMSELKNAYKTAYGNDFNKAVDLIYGESVNKILKHTKEKSAADVVWKIMTIPGKSITIKCPVNVYVYDGQNRLVASVENNKVMLSSESVDIKISNGDEKTVLVYDDSYTIKYLPIAEGNMEITIEEMGDSDTVIRTAALYSVPLVPGTTYTQTVDDSYLEDTDYSLKSNENEIFQAVDDIETGIIPIPSETDITDVVVAEELFDGFSANLIGLVADAMFNMKDSVDVSSYEITTDDLVALFSAIAKYYPSEYSLMSKTNFSYRASVSPSLGIVTKLRFFYDEDVNLSDFQRRVNELDAAVQKIVADCEGMSDFEKLLYVHDYILLHAEYDLELLEMMEAQGTLDGETHSERYSEYSILVNGTGVCGSYALAYRAVLNAMGINCLYLSSQQMNHAWNLVKLNGNWYHVDVCWDDPVPDTYGRARRTYFLLTDEEIMNLSHYSWTPGQYKAADKSFSNMPRGYDITQKLDNNSWYYLKSGSLYKSDIYGKNEEKVCTLSASTFDVDNDKIYFASGKYIYNCSAAGNSLVYIVPSNKLGSKPSSAYIKNLYIDGNNAEYYKYIVDENGKGKIVNEKAEIGKEPYSGITGVCLDAAETSIAIFDTLQLTASTTDFGSVSEYECKWKSSNNNIATVSGSGLVTAKNIGSATITFSTLGFSATCKVTVTGDGLSGSCGEDAVWEFDTESGTLTFSGDGEINLYTWKKCSEAVKKIAIKDDVYFSESILNGFSVFTSLETFDVGFWNDYYKDDSSVALLNKDKTELIKYAPANEAVYYEIPDDVIKIRANALYGSENLQALVIPESVETVQTASFSGCKNVKYLLLECGKTAAAAITPRFVNLKRVYVGDNSVDSLNLNNANRITVYAEDSAQIKNFCSENGIKFVSTDTDNHAHGYYPKEIVDFTDEKDGEIKWYSFCGDDNYTETVHNYDEGEIIPATCISCEKIKRTCKNCGHEDISNAVENDYEVGDIIEFGSYPQSEVKDEVLIAALNKLGGDNKNWTSYNYYSGTGDPYDGQMKPSDYMRYKDVSYNGSKYRAVTFDSYRPNNTGYTSSTSKTYQDDNGYTTGNVYWFKYEPIKWRVLDPSTGLVMCDTAIDSQAYNNYLISSNGEYYGDPDCTYYASNYAKSSIREWLNKDFYNTAFSSSQQSNILYTTLDNSAYSTSYSAYDSESTTDKVFLLSYDDVLNSKYGFSTSTVTNDSARQLKGSDYAKSQGLYVYHSSDSSYDGCSYWRLRSPGYFSFTTCSVLSVGRVGSGCETGGTNYGVVPALRLSNLNSLGGTQSAQYEVGDIIEFGSYPQTLVTDEAVISELSKDESEWISYNYYSGNGSYGSMKPSNYMRYKDVSYNGNKYRAVTFDTYRPYWTEDATSTSCGTYQDDNGYLYGNVYWFKYEPIKWRVLDPSTGLVMCDTAIDSQAYNNYLKYSNGEYYGDPDCTYYASNYAKSSIREWLNKDFYNTAFSSSQQSNILYTTLDNSAYSTSYSAYDSESTTDKVFLLSYDDVLNSKYGFSTSTVTNDSARQLKGSDYAKSQGLYVYHSSDSSYDGCSDWRLRSPGGISYSACRVSGDGRVGSYCRTDDSIYGVVPALKLNLNSLGGTQSAQYEVGDIIEFGSYPQTLVTDEAVISELSKDESEWISYNYYSGTGNYDDGQMTASDYMRYKDVSYNGNKYRAVTFDSYRPYLTGYTTSTSNTYQDDNGYTIGNVYWFKYEPIKWRVLDPSTGLIMCASAIDSQAYNNYVLRKDEIYGDSSCNYYASNYTQSSIRQWLNDDFYNTAFSSEQKSNIATTTLDNSSRCSSSYDAPSTTDKIFLLSDADSINSNYGFSSDYSDWDIARQLKSTDYAKCQGCYQNTFDSYLGNCIWWLRSPNCSYDARVVRYGGNSDYYGNVCYTSRGVVPALKLNLKSDIFESSNLHSPAEHVTENAVDSTCKECGGYDSVTYCSLCGEELEREHISIPVSKHHCFETVETVEPTCTEDGYTKLVCSVCGEERTRTLSSVYAHDFIETVVAPTCTQNGYTKAECTLCGEVEFYDFTSPVGHKLMITNEGEFCENHGTKLYKCSRCDYEEAIAISNDNLVTETIRTEPTCTKAGSEKEICTICGATVSEKILSPVGHSFEEDYTIDRAATCTETGEKSRHCANCEERIFITEIPLAAHSFKDEIIISSCTKQGYTKHSCQNCEYSYCDGYTEINPSAHTIISDEAVAPTCTKTGLTAGSHCSECGQTIVKQEIVPVKNHSTGDWQYEGNGYFIKKCNVCHETANSKQVSICFNVDSISVENGSTKALKPTVTDEFTTDYSFTSSDNSVATVDSDGKLTAKSVGKCNITVTINGTDISDTVPVNVNAREFSLTFVIDGKEQTEKVKEGTPIKTPENISKPGYIFKGWTPSVPPIMLDEDLIFTAVFEFDESVIETAKSELEKIKNDHVSDEAKAIINKAIEDIKEAFNPDTVYSIVDKAKTDAVTADKALVDSKTAANAELDTAKNNAKSDEAKSAIENGKNAVNTATSIDAVNTAKANAITAANNADAAYAEKTKFDKASINVASARTIDYRSIVTITATATDVPADCKLVLYVNGAKAAEGNNESVSHSVGELKSDINYTVKVADKNGNVVKDSNGNELSKDSKITVNAGFFKKLIAFFKGLFKSLPKVEVKPQ